MPTNRSARRMLALRLGIAATFDLTGAVIYRALRSNLPPSPPQEADPFRSAMATILAAHREAVMGVRGDGRVSGTGRQSGPADGLPRLPVQPAPAPAGPPATPVAPPADPAGSPPGALDQQAIDQVADAVMARLRERRDTERDTTAEMPSVDQAIALREQAPEL